MQILCLVNVTDISIFVGGNHSIHQINRQTYRSRMKSRAGVVLEADYIISM